MDLEGEKRQIIIQYEEQSRAALRERQQKEDDLLREIASLRGAVVRAEQALLSEHLAKEKAVDERLQMSHQYEALQAERNKLAFIVSQIQPPQ